MLYSGKLTGWSGIPCLCDVCDKRVLGFRDVHLFTKATQRYHRPLSVYRRLEQSSLVFFRYFSVPPVSLRKRSLGEFRAGVEEQQEVSGGEEEIRC